MGASLNEPSGLKFHEKFEFSQNLIDYFNVVRTFDGLDAMNINNTNMYCCVYTSI